MSDWKRIVPGLLVSIIALAVLFYFADITKVIEAVRLADPTLIGAGFLLTFGWLGMRALFWRALLRERAGLGQVFITLGEGYLINNLLPFRVGEVARAFLLGRKAGLGFWQVFSTILIERALDLAMAAGLLLATIPFVIGAENSQTAALIAAAIVSVGLAGMYFLAHRREQVYTLYERIGASRPFLQPLRGRLQSFLDGLAVITEGGRFLRALLLLVLNWGVATFQYYILLRAFFPQAEPVWAAFTLAVAALGIALPSSPGALGVFEAAVVGALVLFRQDPSTALAFAITAHAFSYVANGAIGSFGLAKDGVSLTHIYRQTREFTSETQGQLEAERNP